MVRIGDSTAGSMKDSHVFVVVSIARRKQEEVEINKGRKDRLKKVKKTARERERGVDETQSGNTRGLVPRLHLLVLRLFYWQIERTISQEHLRILAK